MPVVADIKFNGGSKVYYFDPGSLDLAENDVVIVETSRGMEHGVLVAPLHEVAEDSLVSPLKPILRKATAQDLEIIKRNEESIPAALAACEERIKKHNVEMKLVNAEYSFEGNKIVFYFTADGRIDFRSLVKDLASHFKMRIELRQIGARDECKMLGGLAPCGRACCCSSFLPEFEHATIKMAKTQGFPINPAKISGLCGRLMCCLKYENEFYVKASKLMPKQNSEITTPDGKGTVIGNNLLKESVRVRVEVRRDVYEIRDYPLDTLRPLNPHLPPAPAPTPCPCKEREEEEGEDTDNNEE